MFDRSRPYMKYSIPEFCQITADCGETETVALSPKCRSWAGSYRKRGRGLTAAPRSYPKSLIRRYGCWRSLAMVC
jgi:hypothetical protein